MRILVTGSAGHLGEALMRTLQHTDHTVIGTDLLSSPFIMEKAPAIGFGRYIISATTPFTPADLFELRMNAPQVMKRIHPHYEEVYACRNWRMFPSVDRVYVNARAREELGWRPRYDFAHILTALRTGSEDLRSPLAQLVGIKGYHAQQFMKGPYPVTDA